MITYSHALDEKGQLVCIDEIKKEERYKHTYTCLGCNKQLVPRLGETNRWHFAHKSDEAYNGETYLHRLTKYTLKKKFETQEKFEFVITQTALCSNFHKCEFKDFSECKGIIRRTIDLKSSGRYDTCEVEKAISNGLFKPDVLIRDSSKRHKDVLIEIWVKHKSREEKRNFGLPIIEIRIKDESQITDLLNNPIGYEDATYAVEYINFYKESKKTLDPPLIRKFIDYFYIDYSRRAHIEEGRCENQYKNIEDEAFKLAIDYSWGTRNNYLVALLYCLRKNRKTCFCPLCFFSGTDSQGRTICKRYKTKGTPHFPMRLPVIDCPYFSSNKELVRKLEEDMENTIIVEIE